MRIEKNYDRVIISDVLPQVDGGRYPIKRVVGEVVGVTASIYADGHDDITAFLLYKPVSSDKWKAVEMALKYNDEWFADFGIEKEDNYEYTIHAWIDHFQTWRNHLIKKMDAGQNVDIEYEIGRNILKEISASVSVKDKKIFKKYIDSIQEYALSEELLLFQKKFPLEHRISVYENILKVKVDPPYAAFSAWYELFPRSCAGGTKKHGTFRDCAKMLQEISEMGFNIVYLPPVHPIGTSHRKGKNNATVSKKGEPGSPWAIGSSKGGHKSIEPALGTMKDFTDLIKAAEESNLLIAMDIALQCSPDHPYIKEHPEWFTKRPDGTIQYAENPPKKYEDIVPINFDTEDKDALWEELTSIFLFWASKGIKCFRVDNPHTKPFYFWEYVINEVQRKYPETIFLSEAFTRPKKMYHLGKLGFTQSYTYFTWREKKWELIQYIEELTKTSVRDIYRPNFWPNTPDILAYHLQHANRAMFIIRYILASTMSSNYGIYGPAYELCDNEPFLDKEEYNNSEKYEIKKWDRSKEGNLVSLITKVNMIRKENPALQTTYNLEFIDIPNDEIIAYIKKTENQDNVIIVVVNLSSYATQSGFVSIPLESLNIGWDEQYKLTDLMDGKEYFWRGSKNFIELDPGNMPAHVFKLEKIK